MSGLKVYLSGFPGNFPGQHRLTAVVQSSTLTMDLWTHTKPPPMGDVVDLLERRVRTQLTQEFGSSPVKLRKLLYEARFPDGKQIEALRLLSSIEHGPLFEVVLQQSFKDVWGKVD